LRILVVDDEESVLRYLAASLSHHDVVVETDGDAAVERATEGTFDIILCDLMMPRKTGMEIHADLQQRRPAMADRMIFMTGGVFVEEAAAFLSDLSGRWVEKPIDFGELEGRIWARMEAPELEQPVS
jgi:DNA-binding response OmpR family regulator